MMMADSRMTVPAFLTNDQVLSQTLCQMLLTVGQW